MTTSAYLAPTEYEQPQPPDGVYAATVFETHAEFDYQGRKVLAKMRAQGSMNAHNNSGKVVVQGDEATISWDGSAPLRPLEYPRTDDRESSLELSLIATLVPAEFEQRHPFTDNPRGYRTRTRSINVYFDTYEKYEAVLDGYVQFSVIDAPCTIKPLDEDPMKCLVVFDDETIFMAKRFGRGVHDRLVEKAVSELKDLLAKK